MPVIHASLDQYSHNGWSMDHQGLAPVDVPLLAEPEAAVADLLEAVRAARPVRLAQPDPGNAPQDAEPEPAGDLIVPDIARALGDAVGKRPVTLIRAAGGWPSGAWHFREPLDYLGVDGGGGIGSGPGIAVGAALALKGSGFEDLADTPFEYLELHLGYYTRGYDEYRVGGPETPRRTIYFGVGLNVTKLLSPLWDTRVFNYFQVPYTYLPYDDNIDK